MSASETLKKYMGRKLTVMLIPHNDIGPIRINLSFALLGLLALSWSGLTIWSGFIASRHVDYWKTKADEHVLRAKVWYFSQEVKRSREYMDRVRETEIALQDLLNMKTRKAIVQSDHAMGGPSSLDRRQLSELLTGNPTLSIDDMSTELEGVKKSGSDVMANFDEISAYIKDQHELFRSTPEDWPTQGRLTSGFGMRKSPFEEDDTEHFHRGLDIANALGTPVHATADGIVRVASWQGGFGRLVVIDHSRGFQTYYGHNSQLLVKVGDHVKRGQVISYMGTSGRSTGYHLHYEVWQNGRAVDPIKFVKTTEG